MPIFNNSIDHPPLSAHDIDRHRQLERSRLRYAPPGIHPVRESLRDAKIARLSLMLDIHVHAFPSVFFKTNRSNLPGWQSNDLARRRYSILTFTIFAPNECWSTQTIRYATPYDCPVKSSRPYRSYRLVGSLCWYWTLPWKNFATTRRNSRIMHLW